MTALPRVHLDAAERLLQQLLRARWTGEPVDAEVAARLQPDAFRRVVQLHGLAGVLQNRHAAQLQVLPDALRAAVVELRRRAVLQSLVQLKALRELVTALEAAGIATLPLKGLPLSWRLYGDVTIRQSGDIDVLVDPDAVADALAVMIALGYRPPHPLPDGELHWRERMRDIHHVDLQHPDGSRVELHWRTDPLRSTSLPRLSALLPALGRIDEGPLKGMRMLPPDLLQQSLASHACRSLCARWKWGYDLLEIVSTAMPCAPPWHPSILAAQDTYTRQTLRLQAAQWSVGMPMPLGLRLSCRAAEQSRQRALGVVPGALRSGLQQVIGFWMSLTSLRARREYLGYLMRLVPPKTGETFHSLATRGRWLASAWSALGRRR